MKSITRLYLSKKKQGALSLLRRVSDVRNGIVLAKQSDHKGAGEPETITQIHIENVIEDRSWCNLRVTMTAPWHGGEEFSCSMRSARGESQSCQTFVIAHHALTGDSGCTVGEREGLSQLLVTIRIPKRITSYAFELSNDTRPDARGSFILKESEYGRMLHEARMLVQTAENDHSYSEWLRQHKASEETLAGQRATSFDVEPIFSIIVPLYKTPIDYLKSMIGSVFAQTYPYWQLILVNASPEIGELDRAVAAYASEDARITVVTLQENLGITLNTNKGIEAAIGDFICFFDHDDIIEPDILFEYARAINDHPTTDIIYCDEDKLLPNGDYMHPLFKPDYSTDLLRRNNYICHMLTIRSSILTALEPAGSEFDGAQDYNCVLRSIEKARRIHHVQRMLYHWRISPGSTAGSTGSKPYAINAGKIALEQHYERCGIDARVEPDELPFRYNTSYRISGSPLVSIIIPSCDDARLLSACVSSIAEKTAGADYETIIVNCGTTDPETLSLYATLSSDGGDLRVVSLPESGEGDDATRSHALKFGAECARGEYVVFLPHDARIATENWLLQLLEHCQRNDVGAVGARIMCEDGTIFHSGICIGGDGVIYLYQDSTPDSLGYFGFRDDIQDYSAVSPSCMMTGKSSFLETGGFDEAFSDELQGIDYCLRLRESGKLIVFNPHVEIVRHEPYPLFGVEGAAGIAQDVREMNLFKQRWVRYFAEGDPFHNGNLQKTGPGAKFYHLARESEPSFTLGLHGIEYTERRLRRPDEGRIGR